MNVLWIALCAPYDTVPHAGGQNLNYYLKKFLKEDNIHVNFISFCEAEEINKIDLQNFNLDFTIYCEEKECTKLQRKINNLSMRFQPFQPFANFLDKYKKIKIIKKIKKLKSNNYKPDVIILHWTQMVLLVSKIRTFFPSAKYIAIEEDVALLGFQRKVNYTKNIFKKGLYYIKFKKLEKKEIEALSCFDLIFVTNKKDQLLLQQYGINKAIYVLNSYFHNMTKIKRKYNGNRNIIYYGAMNRSENYLSAIWFIKHVMPLLGFDFTFYVIGNNPPQELKKLESTNIKITGFVDFVEPFFESSLCLVAPLVLGAGIKLKIIEALSAGIPVLTNDIGVEGIDILHEKEFLLCKTPEDYCKQIKKLYKNQYLLNTLERNSKNYINNYFSYEKTYNMFYEKIYR